MSPAVGVAALAVAAFVVLMAPARPRAPSTPHPVVSTEGRPDLLRRLRWCWALCAAGGALGVVPGPLAPVAAVGAGVGTWVLATRAEPSSRRRAREAARRDLASLVDLFAGALSAGAPPALAVQVVCDALPGAAADRLRGVRVRLDLGVDPEQVWEDLAEDEVLAPLGRTLARAHASGASVAVSVGRLADDLAHRARADVEDRARAVGVKAALPLGLCLLPAFLVLGVVPMVAGMVTGLLR